MSVSDVVQLITTLGFPIALVIVFLLFFNAKIWPWFTSFMQGFIQILQQNTSAMQTMTAAITAVAEEIKAQPNADLSRQTAVLTTRMDEQHLQLSQQMASMKTELVQRLDTNLGYIKEIAPGVRPGPPKARDVRG